jgi:hypothetical protein
MKLNKNFAATACGLAATLTLMPMATPVLAQEADNKQESRQTDKNNMRNLGIGLGSAAILQAIRGKHTEALNLGAGAAYAGKKAVDQDKAQKKNDQERMANNSSTSSSNYSGRYTETPMTPVAVTVDSDRVAFNDQGPEVMGGRVYVPLRGVLEKMGAEVKWDNASRSIMAQKGSRTVVLPTGGQATVNGNPVPLDAPAYIASGRTMVPLRFMAEAFGADVNYDSNSRQVSIQTQGKNASVKEDPNT